MGKRVTTVSFSDETDRMLDELTSFMSANRSSVIEEAVKILYAMVKHENYQSEKIVVNNNVTVFEYVTKKPDVSVEKLKAEITALRLKLNACNSRQSKIVKMVSEQCPNILPEVAKMHYSSALSA